MTESKSSVESGWAKYPRWYGEIIAALDDAELRVLNVLISLDGKPGADDAAGRIAIGLRKLATLSGRSVPMTRRAITGLLEHGLITRWAPGRGKRDRYTIVREKREISKRSPARELRPRNPHTGKFTK